MNISETHLKVAVVSKFSPKRLKFDINISSRALWRLTDQWRCSDEWSSQAMWVNLNFCHKKGLHIDSLDFRSAFDPSAQDFDDNSKIKSKDSSMPMPGEKMPPGEDFLQSMKNFT